MDHPALSVSNIMGNSIGLKKGQVTQSKHSSSNLLNKLSKRTRVYTCIGEFTYRIKLYKYQCNVLIHKI